MILFYMGLIVLIYDLLHKQVLKQDIEYPIPLKMPLYYQDELHNNHYQLYHVQDSLLQFYFLVSYLFI